MEGKTLQPQKKRFDFVVVGLALFAMFFGAGNLIFPPDLGLKTGTDWFLGFVTYFIVDAGLAVVGVLAMIKADGKTENVTNVAGKFVSVVVCTASILAIGPGLAIPRNGAVTYSLGIAPLFGFAPDDKMALAVFSVVFFGIVLLLTIRPSKVVDIVGKVLTPALVGALVLLIFIGVFAPKGEVMEPVTQTVVKDGIVNGYQTLDAIASLFFGIVIINAVKSKGYSSNRESSSTVLKASVITGVILFVVYGGLAFLGATTGTLWRDGVVGGKVDQATLLINITNKLLGGAGVTVLAIIVALACLTTAIGLTTATAEYFENLTNGKLSYKTLVIVISVVSAVLCNMGLAQILTVSVPVLLILYPVVLLLMCATFLHGVVKNSNAYKLSCAVTFIVSLLTVANDMLLTGKFNWIHKLPLDSFGINWVVPAVVAFVVGAVIPGKEIPKREEA